MLNWLDEKKFKKLTMWAIYTMLFCQAFPLLYFSYELDNPSTQIFWTVGLVFPALIALIGILRPDLVVKSLSDSKRQDSEEKRAKRGRIYATLTFFAFAGAIAYLWLF